jgi:lipopolysaccharide/colanic/teichoic acid biosynthesis glycosyltransferase
MRVLDVRVLDVTVSLVALAVLAPLLLLVAVAVKCSSPGPVLYRARRAGQYGHPFTLYKFRSMVVGAPGSGPRITGTGDSRITPVGRILRRTKLDELPQFFNTLKGDMSLVGPRPEDPELVETYSTDQRRLLTVKPGITSPATVLNRYEEELLSGPDPEAAYRRDVLPRKLRMELEYLDRRTVGEDLRVLGQTVLALFARRARLGVDRGSEWRI